MSCETEVNFVQRRAKLSVKKKTVLAGEFDQTSVVKTFGNLIFPGEKQRTGEFLFQVEKLFFFLCVRLFRRKNNVVCDIKFEKYRFINFPLKNTLFLTSWYVVPVGSVDDVVVPEEVFVVAGPPVWVGHHLVK